MVPRPGVVALRPQHPLFSDYAGTKYRTVWIPPGKSVTYTASGLFDLPVGTVMTKSFGFAADQRKASPISWLETRVMVRAASGWKGTSYVWDAAHHDAVISGRRGDRAAHVPRYAGPDRAAELPRPEPEPVPQVPRRRGRDGHPWPVGRAAKPDVHLPGFVHLRGRPAKRAHALVEGGHPSRALPPQCRPPSSRCGAIPRPAPSRPGRALTCRRTARIATTGRAAKPAPRASC